MTELDTFKWNPRGSATPTSQALNTRVEFINGNEQVQSNAKYPKMTWEFTYEDEMEEINAMQDFFNAHAPAGQLFYIYDQNGVRQRVRFASDTFAPKLIYGGIYKDGKPQICAVGGSVTLQFRKVW